MGELERTLIWRVDSHFRLLGDLAAHLRHCRRRGVEICSNQVAPFLGIELRGNAGRIHQIAKRNREIAALADSRRQIRSLCQKSEPSTKLDDGENSRSGKRAGYDPGRQSVIAIPPTVNVEAIRKSAMDETMTQNSGRRLGRYDNAKAVQILGNVG